MSVQNDLLNDEKYKSNQILNEAAENADVCFYRQNETEILSSSWQDDACGEYLPAAEETR